MKKRVPAEWETQQMVQLNFPHQNTDWKDILPQAVDCFVQVAQAIAERQTLLVVCQDIEFAKQQLLQLPQQNIIYRELPTNDTWARDTSPISLFEKGKHLLLDFSFNGWGLKFPADKDNQITPLLFAKENFLQYQRYKNCQQFILEGGSIESDGKGTILTTEDCLLSKNRNSLTKRKIEKKLQKYLGAKRILWLKNGSLIGDDTDSHIDTLARFCSIDTIAYVKCADTNDPHYDELKKMEQELQKMTTDGGVPYRLIDLPMPPPIYDAQEQRLPATYANFLIINQAVLLPTYAVPTDTTAIEKLQKAFPQHDIVPIDCQVLIQQHGSLHCITMQYPSIL